MNKHSLKQTSAAVAFVIATFCCSGHAALVFENAKPPQSAMPAKDTVAGDATWLAQPLDGFGHAVPLRLAVQRMLPGHVQVEYMPDVDLDQPITWDSGERRKALQTAFVLAKLRAEVSEQAVTIERFDYTETVSPSTKTDATAAPAAATGGGAGGAEKPAPAAAVKTDAAEQTHWRFPAGYPLKTCLSVVLSRMGLTLDWQVEDSDSWTMPTTRSFDASPRDALKVVRDEIMKYAAIVVRIDGNVVTATRSADADANVSLGPQATPSEGD